MSRADRSIVLFYNLLKAIPKHAALLFVGDIDQLPSVGSGAVLQDMIKSGTISTVRLTEIFRQAKDSKIILNSHRINEGQIPLGNIEIFRMFNPNVLSTIHLNFTI